MNPKGLVPIITGDVRRLIQAEVSSAPDRSSEGGQYYMRRLLIALVSDTGGQDLIEYALLAGLISLAAVTAVINVGGGVNGVWGSVDTQMAAVPSP